MRVLITGITGYIGSRLARTLLGNHEVYGLVRNPLRLTYIEDIQDNICFVYYDGSYESMSAAVAASRPELIYHLAAYYTGNYGKKETPELIASNIVMGAYLLEAMVEWECSALVYVSTVMAHYRGETYRPLNLYAATKQAFSDLLSYYTDAGLLRAVTLVLADTYGPGDQRPKILNLVKKAAKSGSSLALSDGKQDYDVVYIDDVVQAFQQAGEQLLASDDWDNKTFQVCSQKVYSLRETVECMLQVNQAALAAMWGQRLQPEREMRQAVRLYSALPGWAPQVPREEGLRRFWQD